MTRDNKFSVFAKLILVVFMSSSICQTLYTSFFMTFELSRTIFIIIIPICFLIAVMFRNKLTALVSAICLILALIGSLAYIMYKTGLGIAELWIYNYSSWLIDLANGYIDTTYKYYPIITEILLAVAVSLLVYILTVKLFNLYAMAVLGLSIFYIQLYLEIFVSNFSFGLFIFSLLMYYFFDISQKRAKDKSYELGNHFKYTLFVIPVCIIIVGLGLLFPMKDQRIAIPWLDTRIDKTISNVIDYFSGADIEGFDYFSINSSGFGSSSKLGGNIKLNKTHVMNVKSEYSNLYLRAASKAYYDGHGWYDESNRFNTINLKQTRYMGFISEDYNQFLAGNALINSGKINADIFVNSKAQIDFVNIKTRSLFVPLKLDYLAFKSPQTIQYDAEQMLASDRVQKKGFSYTVDYASLFLGNEEFKNLLRKSYKGFNKDNMDKLFDALSLSQSPNVVSFMTSSLRSMQNFNTTSNKFYEKYTQLPEDITPRVRQLAQDLTKDKTTTYDKAKAVEEYLSKNYPYTLKPGTPPRKKDFVDYFLFEGKKGYCTYYASAMTVLLRCADIPARYVEGYILPPESKNGVFEVTNQQGHAWVEVYFEGVGWIPFEPTSPFVANMYSDRSISATVSSDMSGGEYTDYMDMMNRYRDRNAEIDFSMDDIHITEEKDVSAAFIVLVSAGAVAGLILLTFIILASVNMLRVYNTMRKIRKADPNTGTLYAYSYILKALRIHGTSINTGETPTHFGQRVEKIYDFKSYTINKTNFIKVTDIYVKARYSRLSLTNKEKQEMLDFIDELLQLTYEKIGRFKFTICIYLFGKL